jgi:Fe-S-cluster containining protein
MKEIRQYLSEKDRDTIDRVCELFGEVDDAADQFRILTRIKCPERCGECCTRSAVETTAIEMMPMALELWRNNEAESCLERIEEAPQGAICVFYKSDPGNHSLGRCTVYEMRPLICRLFGFFTARNKYGKYVYHSCRVIRRKYPEIFENAVRQLSGIEHQSGTTDYSMRIMGMDAGLGGKIVPINHAAAVALKKIGYWLEHTNYSR